MLAAGLSESQATEYLGVFNEKASPLRVVVACINSPSSVTLAGDEVAINALESQLREQGIFVRRLRVTVAYHSPQMKSISDAYRRAMSQLQPGSFDGDECPTMISTVTAERITPYQLLNTEYWAQNMERPVRFSHAVAKAMSDLAKINSNGDTIPLNSSSAPIDMVEIGPRGALQGPFQDIATSLSLISPINYVPALRRNGTAAESFLEAMGRLHCLGHQIDILTLNNPTNKPQNGSNLLPELPTYPFDHSKRYWCESRLGRDFRLHKTPRSDLLGSPALAFGPPQMTKRWRKITRTTDTPWISDHVVSGVTLYPAAGMLSMAIEAASQSADPGKHLSAVWIKEAVFSRPLYVSSAEDGVESHLELGSWIPSGNSSFAANFIICSRQDEEWVENCRGTISIDYENQNRTLHGASNLDAFSEPRTVSASRVYETFRSMGLAFGPAFQALENITVSSNHQARSQVRTFESQTCNGMAQDHIIHPITLDAVFQTALVALTQTTKQRLATAVPSRVENIWISGKGAAHPSVLTLQVAAEITRQTADNTTSRASAHDEQGNMILSLGSLETRFIDSFDDSRLVARDRGTCYHIAYRPDIDHLSTSGIAALLRSTTTNGYGSEHFDDLSLCFQYFCVRVLEALDPTKVDAKRPYLHRYLQWMKEHVARSTSKSRAEENLKSLLMDEDHVNSVFERISEASASGKALVEIGRNLTKILGGEIDPLEVIFKSGLAEMYYREANSRIEPALGCITELVAFKHPGLNVLEIGAGTGSTTELVLKYACIEGERGEPLSAISTYDFTDISPAFFARARERFAAFGRRMKFTTLDISKDPSTQGFQEGFYDLIIAANVLHATPDLNITLRNARRLLKQGGKLMMMEITENQWVPQMIFGTLPGWWLSTDEYRSSGPCISTQSWDRALSRNGFSGTDVVSHDSSESRDRICSIMVATAIEGGIAAPTPPATIILVDSQAQASKTRLLFETVRDLVLNSNVSRSVEVLSLTDAPGHNFSNKFCISLLEVSTPLLASMDESKFLVLRNLLSKSGGVLWVRDVGISEPAFSMSDGLFRVLRTENEDTRYVNLAVSTNCVQSSAGVITEVAKKTMDGPSHGIEVEYEEIQGLPCISRAVPAVEINNHVGNSIHQDFTTRLDPNATYVLAGGFGGVARSICRWMVGQGARNLLLLSRSGPTSSAARSLLEELTSQGVHSECPNCDISSVSDLQKALETYAPRLPPIRGCIQGALVLQDSIFETMTHSQWSASLSPRIAGTQNLFNLLPQLSFFVLLSSVNGVIGNPSQANYAASNTYLDAFARCHSTARAPIISIDVGWVDFAGTVAESKSIQEQLARLGCLKPMSEKELLTILDYFCDEGRLTQGLPSQTITGIGQPGPLELSRLSWNLLDRPLWRGVNFLNARAPESSTTLTKPDDGESLRKSISNASSSAEIYCVLLKAIVVKLAADLGVDEEVICGDKPLHEAGVDSLMAVQVRMWFRRELDVDVSVFSIMSNQSLKSLTKTVAEMVGK